MAVFHKRITIDPAVCHGQPCVRGTRVMVWLVHQYLSNGDTPADIVSAYPALMPEDVEACLAFAA